MIKIKIDLKKIDQTKCFRADSGAVYLDAVLFESKNPKYDDTHVIVQSIPKAERDAGKRGAIIGNAKVEMDGPNRPRDARPPSPRPATTTTQDDGEIPF